MQLSLRLKYRKCNPIYVRFDYLFQLITATGSPVVLPDQKASNGVIHVINRVMFPLPLGDLVSTVVKESNLTTLVKAVTAAKLATTLSGISCNAPFYKCAALGSNVLGCFFTSLKQTGRFTMRVRLDTCHCYQNSTQRTQINSYSITNFKIPKTLRLHSLYSKWQNLSVMDLASYFRSFRFEYLYTMYFGFRFSNIFDSNAADERLLLETRVHNNGICHI